MWKRRENERLCQRYSIELVIDINLLTFLYEEKQLDLELTYNEIN